MKSKENLMKDLEKELLNKINRCILDLVSVKFGSQISEFTKMQISDMVQYHLNECPWLEQMKENLNSFILEYTKSLQEEKSQLNIRMDHIEQQLLNLMGIMEKHHLLIKIK